jgi:dihydroxyacid dehydratase/phosphogluconate dehydratase
LLPSGRFLMEDFCYAGGLSAVIRELLDAGLLHGSPLTVTGTSVDDSTRGAPCWNREVIGSVASPVQPPGSGTAVLRGNLCPDGAVIKPSAASPELLRHGGRAVVFDSPEAYHAVSDDDDLDVVASDVLVIRGAGPCGYPGMPEVSNVPLPAKLLREGVRDMVRVCDGRMSGTGYGTVVLHVSPESAVGGPLALVRTGDVIALDVAARSLTLEVADDELTVRRAAWRPPDDRPASGYSWLYTQHVLQAPDGVDFGFLRGRRGSAVGRESH